MSDPHASAPKPLSDPTPSQLTMLIYWEKALTGGAADNEERSSGSRKQEIKRADLAAHTVASALMALRDENSISMECVERRMLGVFRSNHVMVGKTHATVFPPNSFEGQLWTKLDELSRKLDEKPVTIRRLVRTWFGRPQEDPYERVLFRGWVTLAEAGLLTSEQRDRGRVSRVILGTRTFFRPAPRAAELLPQVRSWHVRLTEPGESDGELRRKVFKEVSRAISSRKAIEGDAG